mmetsp:Transcript_16707/g.47723  ORF Transcript_16707/g.47723 Transcript_16707/m.47723 type:complete len:382 (+) Transcript_16707:346-1491(+)
MILTLCTACAAPLPDEPMQCAECATRYCSERCERYDRRRGGHGKICGAVASGGGAEQYHADKKYKEAVAVAVEACAEDTKGQTCYICTQALHWKTKEGLVRMCSCRGTSGFAHVSCLAEEARILVAEAEENNLRGKVFDERWVRWNNCGLCKQEYHGVVYCALGWACWKTYVGRPEANVLRMHSMTTLGNGLRAASQNRERLGLLESQFALMQRSRVNREAILAAQGNMANCLEDLGRIEDAIELSVQVHSGMKALRGNRHTNTIICGLNLAASLQSKGRTTEAQSLAAEYLPISESVFGPLDVNTLGLRSTYLRARCRDPDISLDDWRKAVSSMDDLYRTAVKVLGTQHPLTVQCKDDGEASQKALAEIDAQASLEALAL